MNRILQKAFIFFIVVILSGIYIGCSSTSKQSSTSTAPQHGQGGGCGH